MRAPAAIAPIAAAVAAAGALLPATALAFEERFPGGQYEHVVAGGQDYHLLRVDLCAPGIRVRATKDDEKGQVVSRFGAAVGAAAAVNADFFNGSFGTNGPAMGDGQRWGGDDHGYVAPVSFGRSLVDMPHHANGDGPPPWAEQVVSGHPTLLDDLAEIGNPDDPLCTNRHPRTALGLTQDHRTLILLVVDGRRGGAAGMTCPEMAAILRDQGAFDALNMDGGGSSTLWLANGGVMNQPSDGHERTVANHLAVIADGAGPAPHCPVPEYRAEFVAQSYPPAHESAVTLHLGETIDGSMDLRNTGRATWGAETKLAPIPRDAASPLAAASWLNPGRVSAPPGPVPPGEVGHFALPLTGNALGEFDQAFGLVQEGVTWFADNGGPPDTLLRVRVTVVPPPDAAPPDAAPPPVQPEAGPPGPSGPPDGASGPALDAAPRPPTDDAFVYFDGLPDPYADAQAGAGGPTKGLNAQGGCAAAGHPRGAAGLLPLIFGLAAAVGRRKRFPRRGPPR